MCQATPPNSQNFPHGAAGHSGGRWRRIRRWLIRLLVIAIVAIGLLALPLAITTRITPPPNPVAPQTVYLIDHGITSSLVLPLDEGGIVRYYYADWNYFLLGNRGWTDAVAALCWPTTASLGRQWVVDPQVADSLRQKAIEGTGTDEKLYSFEVDQERITLLREQLDAMFAERHTSLHRDEAAGMDYITHPRDYTYFHNSNRVTADWLRELGCEVRGPAINSRWRVESR